MPHRPNRQPGTSSDVSGATTFYSPAGVHGAPLDSTRGHTAAHIMRPDASAMYTASPSYYQPAAGMVTPMKKTHNWIMSANGLSRSMPHLATPKSSDSADQSTSTKHDDSTVGTLQTEGSSDEREKREATAALLNISSLKFAKSNDSSKSDKDSSSVGTSSSSNSSTVPLKKRKNLDFLRPKSEPQTTESPKTSNNDPCHVSPVSHSSQSSQGRSVGKDEVTPDRSQSTTTRSDSYDSKESPYGRKESAQPLLDSSKITSPTEIGSTFHFPSILHKVLSDAGRVVEWVEDGESFKVLRWDALSREILPNHFPDITDETGKGRGTIDAFLCHLTAWGFKELKDGSYKHDLFIRGAQKLCSKMSSSGIPVVVTHDPEATKTISPLRESGINRSLLQMPPLSNSRPESGNDSSSQSNKRARFEGYARPASSGTLSWPSQPQDAVAETSGWRPFYSDANQVGMRLANGQYINSAYDPRYQQMSHHGQHPQSPPQVTRSGRGSLRLPSSSRPSVVGSSNLARASFPVSNRGKGSRKNTVCRSSIPAASSLRPLAAPAIQIAEIPRVGAAQHGVAMAVSRKTKRKLPLAQKTVLNTDTAQ